MQETALAQHIVVYCGSTELSWDMMAAIAYLLRQVGSTVQFAIMDDGIPCYIPAPPPGDKVSRMEYLRIQCSSGIRQNGAPDDILIEAESLDGSSDPRQYLFSYFKRLLEWVRPFEATCPHDKIYSVLGMVKLYLPQGLELPVVPDYSMSVLQLYTETTFKLIEELPLLSVLSMAGDKSYRKMSGLPSWVPDFSQDNPLTLLTEVLCSRGHGGKKFISGNSRSRRMSNDTLHIHGAFVDSIKEMAMSDGPDHSSFDFKRPTILIWLQSMLKLLRRRARKPYFTGESYLDVFWKTLIIFIESYDTASREYHVNNADEMAESFRCWLVDLLTMPVDR